MTTIQRLGIALLVASLHFHMVSLFSSQTGESLFGTISLGLMLGSGVLGTFFLMSE